ncbi:dTDP-4-amino-4,6-dideoxygalactose transaminase [Azospirillum fermentarium]|uniref:DegT/DnrJ/EryC1/StrS family aminotransferase n=1 Tax=Azospirillum fermentarium TaxID=1233114 RepID=UPI002227EB64|nr:DegT/DnrJ/EryC1/StrS family aminotransferase [Azospirillum fermentarium]MCW2249527.1 dTDP-4-amino-4,6-dideoxygalactose transaminase [Azospirillum fermentarium]
MTSNDLALLGGTPVIGAPLAPYNQIGPLERARVLEVMDSGVLSGFIAVDGPEFDGGPMVRELERQWCGHFGCRYAVTVNSATSGLYAAMGAIGLEPGDEVIVPPYTMSATAMAPLIYGGIPVFVDIEPETFCLDPAQVAAAITPRTRAILAVNLFGHPARLAELRALADARGLYLVEDNAQGPLAAEHGRQAGTVGHIGVFSLNRHKHVQTGEGGVCVTDDERLALRLRLIRNHGENLIEAFGVEDASGLVGFNYRLSELSAAVGLAQLERAGVIVSRREELAARLTAAVSGLEGLTPPAVRAGCRHVYYVWAARYDAGAVGVPRALFAQAMAAEGVPLGQGYVRPLYRLPPFQRRQAFGGGWPFSLSERRYPDGLAPVCERMHETELLSFAICSHQLEQDAIDRIADAFHKVHAARHRLAALAKGSQAA